MEDIGPRIKIFRVHKCYPIGGGVDYSWMNRNPSLSAEYGCYLCTRHLYLVDYCSDGRLFEGEHAIGRLKESGHFCCAAGAPVFYGNIDLRPERLTISFERETTMKVETLVGFLQRTFRKPEEIEGEQIFDADPTVLFGGEVLGRLGEIINKDLGLPQ